ESVLTNGMWRATRFPELRAQVKCSGAFHTVVRTADGRVCLLDHSRQMIWREFVLRRLRGQVCRCVRLLLDWRECLEDPDIRRVPDGKISGLACRSFYRPPADFRRGAIEAAELWQARGPVPWESEADNGPPLSQRPSFLSDIINRLLHGPCSLPPEVRAVIQCRRSRDYQLIIQQHDVKRYERPITRHWMARVHAAGAGVLDGCL